MYVVEYRIGMDQFQGFERTGLARRAVGNSDSFCLFGAKKDKNVNGRFYFYWYFNASGLMGWAQLMWA